MYLILDLVSPIVKVKGRMKEPRKIYLKNLVRKMKNRNSKNDFITANANN